MSDRTELLLKAEELGLNFPKNIPTLKLEELIIESLESEVNPSEVDEESLVDDFVEEPSEEVEKVSNKLPELELRRNIIRNARERAYATQIVTITNRDNRENDFMTTAYLSFENQHFGLSKLVPLDIPVELEQGLIDVAESTMITLHKDEIVAGKRTGNKVPVQVKKFAVSYGRTPV